MTLMSICLAGEENITSILCERLLTKIILRRKEYSNVKASFAMLCLVYVVQTLGH